MCMPLLIVATHQREDMRWIESECTDYDKTRHMETGPASDFV